MSRIGKRTITIPANTQVTVADSIVTVKGPKGELKKAVSPKIAIKIENNEVTFVPANNALETNALWGTVASHVTNMIEGVTNNFTRKLIVEGIGFKADVQGANLNLSLGFSHPVKVEIPSTLKVTSEKGVMTIVGMNKEEVGQFAANIRAMKKPEPYKGKGIRYEDEVIRRKQGKKSV
jgi:large subunit ribosomal protein L6